MTQRRAAPPAFARYVALGESQAEGLCDGDDPYRGWADRLASQLATVNPELRYANLAIRGRLAGQVRAEQLAPALALKPDLATVVAGMNDLLRVVAAEVGWLATFLGPWLGRRLRGRSSGDGRSAKRPELTPLEAAG